MRFEQALVPGRLERRYKRFLADVTLESGELVTAHCPNPGAMTSCMEVGCPVLLRDHQGSRRKLRYGWELSLMGEDWVMVNTARTNAVVAEALELGAVPELAAYPERRPEVPFGERSRVDFLLTGPGLPDCYLEVKNVSLVHGGVSYFPDGVTTRGTRHLVELAARRRRGDRAVLLFLVARGQGSPVRPAAKIDPDYAACLRAVAREGVEILSYRARVTPEEVTLEAAVPVDLDPLGDEAGPLPRGKSRPNRPRGGWEELLSEPLPGEGEASGT